MNVGLNALRAISYAVVTSPYVFVLLIFIFMFYRKNKKTVILQKMIIGEKINSSFELTISQIVLGLFAGALGSVMLSYFGVAFNENTSIELVFLLSIFFMFLNPRLVCFSYSGALLGFISILLEIMKKMYNVDIKALSFLNIDVVALMTLIAILHFVESILIMVDGDRGAIPVFTKKDNKVIGGFALKRYWAIPVAVALIVNSNMYSVNQIIQLSSWNTLFSTINPYNMVRNAAILLVPFYGVIGYSSVTFTKGKKEKSIVSGIMVMIYSILLFVFARLALLNIFFKLFVVIFAPAAHEFMLYIQKYNEANRKPVFVSDENGIMVLEVAPNSTAYSMGIKSGDRLLEVNNKKIFKEDDIIKTVKEASNIAWFKIKRATGKLEEIRYKNMGSSKKLGIVFVPMSVPKDSVVVKMNENKFEEILNKLKK